VQGHGVARPVARTVAYEKGGHWAGATLGANVTHHTASGGVRRAQTRGDFRLRLLVNNDSAPGFRAAMQGLVWFEEETTAEGILPHWHSEWCGIFPVRAGH